MKGKNSSTKNSFSLFIALLFVYVLLFEFILPVNKILPRPSLFFDSFVHIWRDYNLTSAFTITTSVVYLSLIISFIVVFAAISLLFKIFIELEGTILSLRLFRYLPAFFFAIIFNFWFSEKLFAEFVFASLAAIFFSIQKLFEESKNVKEEYILVARNLGLTPSDIYEKVYWKSAQPTLIKYYERIHYCLWGIVLIFEFIGNSNGFGYIYRVALSYKDYTALFTFAIIISLIIWFGNFLIRVINKKLIHWTP